MSDLMPVQQQDGVDMSDSSSAEVVSDLNNLAQMQLVSQLQAAREAKKLTRIQVAECLGATEEMVEDIEMGHYELNLSELRHYAFAIDAVVDYRVRPNFSAFLREIQALDFSSIWQRGNSQKWRSLPAKNQIQDTLNVATF